MSDYELEQALRDRRNTRFNQGLVIGAALPVILILFFVGLAEGDRQALSGSMLIALPTVAGFLIVVFGGKRGTGKIR